MTKIESIPYLKEVMSFGPIGLVRRRVIQKKGTISIKAALKSS
jgi:hypothetical protein